MKNAMLGASAATSLVVLTAITAAIVARGDGANLQTPQRDTNAVSRLAPLPAGEPQMKTFEATLLHVDPRTLPSRAKVVFVGTAVDRGGSEVVAAESPETGPAVTVHRIRFSVDRVFRGAKTETIDLTALDAVDLDPFVLGESYVVFADERTFGDESAPRLAAIGYWQGAFRVQAGEATAVNRRGDRVDSTRPLEGVEAKEQS